MDLQLSRFSDRMLSACDSINNGTNVTFVGHVLTAPDVFGTTLCQLSSGQLVAVATPEYESTHTVMSANFHDMDVIWFIVCGSFVFLMQAGFSMLEAGSVSSKNTVNILFKNILDACIGALFYYGIGSGFAYGSSNGGFIGSPAGKGGSFDPAGDDSTLFYDEFFAFTFAATAATIVSGCVAERCNFMAYFVYSIVITAFIYPCVVHWGWSSDGFLVQMGYVDFAGSGIVHMVGGFAGLVGAVALGPREGRFNANGSVNEKPGHSMVLCSLGVVILWFGWYGFNCGSTLGAQGSMDLAGRVAITTTIAAAAASFTAALISRAMGKFDLATTLNAVIAGLVSITAGCATMGTGSAFFTGAIGAIVYMASSKLLLKLKIDDPLEACPLHGFCGIWGVVAVGIFAAIDEESFIEGGYSLPTDMNIIVVQILGALIIMLWSIVTSALVFYPLKAAGILRVSSEVEASGLDSSEHGADAYTFTTAESLKAASISDAKVAPV